MVKHFGPLVPAGTNVKAFRVMEDGKFADCLLSLTREATIIAIDKAPDYGGTARLCRRPPAIHPFTDLDAPKGTTTLPGGILSFADTLKIRTRFRDKCKGFVSSRSGHVGMIVNNDIASEVQTAITPRAEHLPTVCLGLVAPHKLQVTGLPLSLIHI